MPSKRPSAALAHLLWILVVAAAPLAASEELESLHRENERLRQRLDSVETDLAAIKKLLAASALPAPAGTSAPPAAGLPTAAPSSSAAAPAPFSPAETEKLRSLAALKGRPVRSALDLSFYGYVKLDASYDDSRFSLGNFARWADTESVLPDDDHFNMTANQTRFGVDVAASTADAFQATAKVEFDLYGGGTAENKPEPMLRHAYVRLDWPKHRLALLAGQTSDIISPLSPTTVNYSVVWWQGNVGYRRPQLRLIKTATLAEGVQAQFDGGINRTITGRKAVFRDANDPDTGSDAGYPTFAGRVGLTFPAGGNRTATLGLSGHYGTEEIHRVNLTGHDEFESWSANVDLRVPLGPSVLLQGEAFVGRNFDSHLGGIGQGINTVRNHEIDTKGGWAALAFTPSGPWQFNLGGGVDDPDDADLTGNTAPSADPRTKNSVVFGNAFYSLTTQTQLAFELAWLRTTYKVLAPGEGRRHQFSIIHKF